MKYLKTFEGLTTSVVDKIKSEDMFVEHITTDSNFIKLKNEFTDFANDCLAYLVDQGFIISVEIINTYDGYLIEFTLVKNEGDINFQNGWSWDSIKDDFIPFLEMCNDKFVVFNIKIKGFGNYQVDVNDLISEKSDCPALRTNKSTLKEHKINNISFFIENK